MTPTLEDTSRILPTSWSKTAAPARPIRVWQLPDAWLALIPLIFFAARGTFSFEEVSANNEVAGTYGTMLASDISGFRHNIEMMGYYFIIAILIFRFHRSILSWFLDNKLLASLPLLALASTAWSQMPFRTLSFALMAFAHTAFAIYLTKRFSKDQQMDLYFGLGLVSIVFSLLLVVFYPAAGLDHKEGMRDAWEGMFGQKNHCAIIMAYLLPAAVFVKTDTRMRRVLQIGFIAGALLLVIMTTSRTGWVEIFLLFCFIGVIRLLWKLEARERFSVAILITVISATLAVLAYQAAPVIAVMLGKDPTLTGRSEIWHAVMLAIYKRPLLGCGYYAFWIGMKGEAYTVAMSIGATNLGNAENGVLGMWLEMGAVGVAIVGLILFQMSRMSIRLFSKDHSNYFGFCLCVTFLTVACLGSGDKFMYPHTLEWTFLVVAYASMNSELKALQTESLRA